MGALRDSQAILILIASSSPAGVEHLPMPLLVCDGSAVRAGETNSIDNGRNVGHLSFVRERPPSADRSQKILNSAGRHRDSAARLG
jgi:hypothetical protein